MANWSWQPLSHVLGRHAHMHGEIVTIIAAEIGHESEIRRLDAHRLDVVRREWLPVASTTLSEEDFRMPRFTELESYLTESGDILVRWAPPRGEEKLAQRFSPSEGVWLEHAGDDLEGIVPRTGLTTHLANPPQPEPTTGVTVETEPTAQSASFVATDGTHLGTVQFPAMPGAYVGAFSDTKTALFMGNEPPQGSKNHVVGLFETSYLVSLEDGGACRVTTPMPYGADAAFREAGRIVMLDIRKTDVETRRCPPGAPCKAPKPSHFESVWVIVLDDRG